MINIDKCPNCGCDEIERGIQKGYGSMHPMDSFGFSSNVIAYICTECGYIIAMRVEKPKRFK